MTYLTIVANVTTKADQIELVKSELEKLVDITRAEDGCLQYDLHQDNKTPSHFVFYENWESRERWQAHMNAQHPHNYMTATDGRWRYSLLMRCHRSLNSNCVHLPKGVPHAPLWS